MNGGEVLRKRIVPLVIIYIVSFIIVFLSLSLRNIVINNYILTALISLFVLIFAGVFVVFQGYHKIPVDVSGKKTLRYSMLCHNCNWEWMSNTSDKAPNKCPNCGERSKLELVGWRKVQVLPRKSNKDLTSFFKR